MGKRWYNGKEPCLGCNEEKARSGKNDLCFDCKQDLKYGKAARLRSKELDIAEGFAKVHIERYSVHGTYILTQVDKDSNKTEKLKQFELPDYISGSESFTSRAFRDYLQCLLETLNVELGTPYSYVIAPKSATATTFSEDVVVLPISKALALFNLLDTFGSMFSNISATSYALGNKDGSNLLGKLNSGELSHLDLEKQLNKG